MRELVGRIHAVLDLFPGFGLVGGVTARRWLSLSLGVLLLIAHARGSWMPNSASSIVERYFSSAPLGLDLLAREARTPTMPELMPARMWLIEPQASMVYWSGDFSGGDVSQWAGVQAGTILNQGTAWGASDPAVQGNTVASVVSSPTRHGGYAASLVDNDTTGSGASHDSASVVNSVAQTHASAGEDTYYGWSVYFPIGNKGNWAGPQASWNLFWEWISGGAHYWGQPGGFGINTVGWADDPTGNTNPRIFAAFNVGNDGSYTDPSPYSWVDNTYPFQYDQWIDFVVHIKWTTADLSDRSGAFEIWKNGAKVYSVNGIHTLPNVVENNTAIEIMNYRQTWTRTTTHYIDQVRVGSNYGAVDPSVIR
jgi:hypothetical protein